MRVFKTKEFGKFAGKEGLTDAQLSEAVREIEEGLVDANLGSNLYKKRVARDGQGKSGAYRTLLAYKEGKKTFFVYGFAKNEKDNISSDEKKALRLFSKQLLKYSDKQLEQAKVAGALIEIPHENGGGDEEKSC